MLLRHDRASFEKDFLRGALRFEPVCARAHSLAPNQQSKSDTSLPKCQTLTRAFDSKQICADSIREMERTARRWIVRAILRNRTLKSGGWIPDDHRVAPPPGQERPGLDERCDLSAHQFAVCARWDTRVGDAHVSLRETQSRNLSQRATPPFFLGDLEIIREV